MTYLDFLANTFFPAKLKALPAARSGIFVLVSPLKSKSRKPHDPHLDLKVIALHKQGLPIGRIAKELGISKSKVHRILKKVFGGIYQKVERRQKRKLNPKNII